MTEFAVLRLLDEAPDGRVRMSDLADAVGLTRSRMTRVVEALEAHRLVSKARDEQDGRGTVALLTFAGQEAMHDAQPRHLASARRRVLDLVPPDALPLLSEVLANLATTLTAQPNSA